MKSVLFVCNHNAGRSQMAEAFFERFGPDDVRAESAGSSPATELWPTVVEAMAEVGFDLSERRPRKLLREMQLQADWAVTMGCGDVCPYVPTTVEAWDIRDPAGLPLEEVRTIRDEIEHYVRELAITKIDEIRSDPTAHRWRFSSCCRSLRRSSRACARRRRSELALTRSSRAMTISRSGHSRWCSPRVARASAFRARPVTPSWGCEIGPGGRGHDLDTVRAIRLDITNHVLDLLKELL